MGKSIVKVDGAGSLDIEFAQKAGLLVIKEIASQKEETSTSSADQDEGENNIES